MKLVNCLIAVLLFISKVNRRHLNIKCYYVPQPDKRDGEITSACNNEFD